MQQHKVCWLNEVFCKPYNRFFVQFNNVECFYLVALSGTYQLYEINALITISNANNFVSNIPNSIENIEIGIKT